MIPLHHEPWFTFRFGDDRLIPRFHLEGIEAGWRVSVFKIDPGTGERLGLMTTATVGEGGWVGLDEPIIVRASEAFIVVPEPELSAPQAQRIIPVQGAAGNRGRSARLTAVGLRPPVGIGHRGSAPRPPLSASHRRV